MHWVLIAIAGWLAVAVVLALVIGRAVREADRRERGSGRGDRPGQDGRPGHDEDRDGDGGHRRQELRVPLPRGADRSGRAPTWPPPELN